MDDLSGSTERRVLARQCLPWGRSDAFDACPEYCTPRPTYAMTSPVVLRYVPRVASHSRVGDGSLTTSRGVDLEDTEASCLHPEAG